jgi:hypothetical protein
MAEELAVTATANSESIPSFFIAGIRTDPTAEASAVADPEIPENNILVVTVTCARPPLICPTNDFANDTILSVIPLSFINSPARIKKGIDNKVKESTPEYILVITVFNGTSEKKYKTVTEDKPIAIPTGIFINSKIKKIINKAISIFNYSFLFLIISLKVIKAIDNIAIGIEAYMYDILIPNEGEN